MKVAPEIGHEPAPASLVRITPKPGVPTQSADAAAAWNDSEVGPTALPSLLTFTKLVNKDGKAVGPTSESFQAAAASADWVGTPGFGVILTNEAGAGSWPISGATFILIHKQPPDAAAAAEALKFFAWGYSKGGKMAEDLD